jgi:hypothetical protein
MARVDTHADVEDKRHSWSWRVLGARKRVEQRVMAREVVADCDGSDGNSY